MAATQVKINVPGNHLMVGLLGHRDELLRLVEEAFPDTAVHVRGNEISVEGRDAEAFLDYICGGDLSGPVGKITYTQFLNNAGGIEADVTVTRLAETAYLVITPAATWLADEAWLRRHVGSRLLDGPELRRDGPLRRQLHPAVRGQDLRRQRRGKHGRR